jgi:hypothetical protein
MQLVVLFYEASALSAHSIPSPEFQSHVNMKREFYNSSVLAF